MVKIANEVLAVLGNCTFDGPRLMLPAQLDRKLYTDVNKVLEANGGKWNRSSKAHIFDGDAADAIEQALLTGEFHRVKQELGQFDTPPEVADRVMELADIQPGMSVLEPSAGIGNLAVRAIERGAHVRTIEIDPKRAAALVMRIAKLDAPAAQWCVGSMADFVREPVIRESFDRVVMNPPFAKQADIDHVTHALAFLKPGGRLVSVMSASLMFRTDRETTGFREYVETKRGHQWEKLPADSFKASGTSVNACILTVDV